MHVSYKDGRFQYACSSGYKHYAKRSCQFLSGAKIDEVVVREFFAAIAPAHIDALEELARQQVAKHHELVIHQENDVERLEYAANRAYQQYDSVDPKNRLIAANLESKWESALSDLEQAKQQLERTRCDKPAATSVPLPLREAFTNVGQQLPAIWPQLDDESRRELLRTLITQVNIRRNSSGVAHLRIVWQGSLVSEARVRLRVFSMRGTDIEKTIVDRIRELLDQGKTFTEVATALNQEGHRPCRSEVFTEAVVHKLCHRHGLKTICSRTRGGEHPTAYTVEQMSAKLKLPGHWIRNRIRSGAIKITKNTHLHCYLFPKTRESVDALLALKNGEVNHVQVPEVQLNG